MKIEPFLDYWRGHKDCTPATIRAYRSDLKMFQQFLEGSGIRRITQVNHSIIGRYIEHMRQMKNGRVGKIGLADSTISRRLAAISSYFEFLQATSHPKLRNPLDGLVQRWKNNKEPKPVDDETVDSLLGGITNQRDRVLIALFLATGLRVSEMHSLNRDSISFQVEIDAAGNEHFLGAGEVIGKGRKLRKFYVDELTLRIYAEYLRTRKDDHPALFLSERRKRMSVGAIQYTLRSWCKKLGIPHINVHRLRHTFATNLANAHIDSLVLKDLLGHSSLATSQRYFKLHDTTLARGYFSAMEYLRQ